MDKKLSYRREQRVSCACQSRLAKLLIVQAITSRRIADVVSPPAIVAGYN